MWTGEFSSGSQQSQYDPLGLLSVYMVKGKLLMRKVKLKGRGQMGDRYRSRRERVPEPLMGTAELRKIRFPRCAIPLEG
jgi:hypothetical protein